MNYRTMVGTTSTTSRNARGIDIVIYSQDAVRKHTIQVKALSKRAPVPLVINYSLNYQLIY